MFKKKKVVKGGRLHLTNYNFFLQFPAIFKTFVPNISRKDP